MLYEEPRLVFLFDMKYLAWKISVFNEVADTGGKKHERNVATIFHKD